MDHESARDLAALALDGRITRDEAARLRGHLAWCEACRVVAREMRADHLALRSRPRREAPAHLRLAVLRSIREAERPRPRTLPWLGATAVILCALVVVSGGQGRLLPSPGTVAGQGSATVTVSWQLQSLEGATGGDPGRPLIAALGGRIVVLGSGPGGGRAWLLGGTSWQPVESTGTFSGASVSGLVAGHGAFVAVGTVVDASGVSHAASWRSSDALHWTRTRSMADLAGAAMTAVTAIPDGYLAVGLRTGPQRAQAWWSGDGLTWRPAAVEAATAGSRMTAVTTVGDTLVAVGEDAQGAAAWYSLDGRRWVRAVSGADEAGAHMTAVAAQGEGAVAVGYTVGADQRLVASAWVSPDGLTWRLATTTGGAFEGVRLLGLTSEGPRLTAVGASPSGAVAFASSDGRTWHAVPAGPGFADATLTSAVSAGGEVVVVGVAAGGLPQVWRLRQADDPAPSRS